MEYRSTIAKALLRAGCVLLLLCAHTGYAVAQSCVQPPAGLVSWWPGDGNAQDITDGNPGTLQNGTTFAVGKVGQAFSFDGVDDVVRVGPTVGNFGTSDFTVDFWIKTTSTQAGGILEKRPVCDYTNFWGIRMLPTGQLLTELGQDSGKTNYNRIDTTKAINDGNFHHVALVRQGTMVSVYVDGVVDRSGATPGVINISNSADLIAGTSICPGYRFTGLVDELGIFNRALDSSEIQAIFNAGSAGKCKKPPSTRLSVKSRIDAVGVRLPFHCVPKDVILTIPPGMVAKDFAIEKLNSGVNCGTLMPIPEKGWSICWLNKPSTIPPSGDLIFWYQVQPDAITLDQGPGKLAALTLGPGTYEFRVNGGKEAGVDIWFTLVAGLPPAIPPDLQDCHSRGSTSLPEKLCTNPFEEDCIITPKSAK